MQGLIKNYYYKIVSNLKVFLIFIVLLGISILFFGGRNEFALITFLILTTIVFPFICSIGIRKSDIGKWNQYILSLPVKRHEIIKSMFVTQLIIVIIGIIISLMLFFASFKFYGFAFYRYIDVFLLFSFCTGIIFIMNAIFFPISYLDSGDKVEAISIISLLVSIFIMFVLVKIINIVFEKPSDLYLIIFGILSLILSIMSFILSYFFTTKIYLNQDC